MYPYADLLEPFYKRAFVGGLARAGWTALKGFGPRVAAKLPAAAPAAASAAAPVAPVVGAAARTGLGHHALGFAAGTAQLPFVGSGAGQMAGMAVTALPSAIMGAAPGQRQDSGGREVLASLYRVKRASEGHGLGHKILHTAPYAAWIASQFVENPTLSKALNLGAYAGYAGMSAHEALTNPAEKWTSGTDAVALTAMALADIARMKRDEAKQ